MVGGCDLAARSNEKRFFFKKRLDFCEGVRSQILEVVVDALVTDKR